MEAEMADMANQPAGTKKAVLYRMVMPDHVCPYGLKAKHLLKRAGYEVEDHHLATREATDAFKAEHDVRTTPQVFIGGKRIGGHDELRRFLGTRGIEPQAPSHPPGLALFPTTALTATAEATDAFKAEHDVRTTPQVFIGGKRIGGHDDLRRFLGKRVIDPQATSYRPVIALFAMTALMAMAASHAAYGSALTVRAAEWFIAFSMVVLSLLKLQNVGSFATMFLNYDLLARRWPPYSYIYPFAEGLAGVLMVAGALNWISVPVALFIGTVGAASVFKAVYIDGREL